MKSRASIRDSWNLETLQVEALKFTSRSEFQKKSGSAYNAAGRLKIRDEICSHMTSVKRPDGFWTVERLKNEALKFNTRKEFQQKSGAAYKAAGLLKIRDAICGHMTVIKRPKGFWSLERLRIEALKFDNKVDFREKSNTAFLTASRKKVLEQICSHMVAGKLPNGHWNNKSNCAEEALKYKSRRDFSLANSSAYHGADINGWLDEICAHMEFNPSSDGDVVYIWRAAGQFFNGLQVYKFGITSARLEKRRIVEVARFAKFEYEIVALVNVKGSASDLEADLLKLGISPSFNGFNGASEFRALSENQLQVAIELIRNRQNLKN